MHRGVVGYLFLERFCEQRRPFCSWNHTAKSDEIPLWTRRYVNNPNSASEVPADLVEIGQRAVAAIYAAVQRQAASKIELIEMNSRKLIDPATPGPRPTSQASQLEIQRLEQPIAGAQAETKHLRQERDPLADWSFCLDGDGRSTFCRLVRCQSCCIAASAIMLNCDFNRATVISTR
jgi:hypothetical protein